MKQLLFLVSLLFATTLAFGQTTHGIVASSVDQSEVQSLAFSNKNVWGNSKLSFNLRGDVSGSSIFNVGVFKAIAGGDNFSVPVSLDLGWGQTDSLSIDKGISVGLLPWISVYNKEGLEVVVHGGFSYHMPNPASTTTDERFKALIGVEASYAIVGSLPTVVSVTPAWVRTVGANNSNITGLEISAIVPVTQSLGFLAEVVVPFDEATPSAGVSLGVVFKTSSK